MYTKSCEITAYYVNRVESIYTCVLEANLKITVKLYIDKRLFRETAYSFL